MKKKEPYIKCTDFQGRDVSYKCKRGYWNLFICNECGKIFFRRKDSTGKNSYCSSTCLYKNIQLPSGKTHYKWKEVPILKCDYCGKKIERRRKSRMDRSKYHFCSLDCHHKHRVKTNRYVGKNNPQWNGGISFEPYSSKWTVKLKQKILKRDEYKCALCEKSGRIIHHIDYDKMNCEEWNLITLCSSCHGHTSHNRYFWRSTLEYFIKQKEAA